MKSLSTFAVLLFGLMVSGQEAGKVGELLKNDAKTEELQTVRNNSTDRNNSNVLNNSNYRNSNNRNNSTPSSTKNYRWNYNYGNAEVFLRIPLNGYYTVEVGDQMISNSVGKYRFFDLPSGRIPIAIYENNYLIYRTTLRLQSYSRVVLDFFPNKGLYLLGNFPVADNAYGVNQWDDIWNAPYGSQPNTNYGYFPNVMNPQDFNRFLNSLNTNSFDKDKLTTIRMTARNANFTADQIYTLLKMFDFDKNRLEMGKQLYPKCVDRQNSYVILEAFEFGGWRNQMADYISNFR